MRNALLVVSLLFVLFGPQLVYAQDSRLASVKRVYIVPNGDDKETQAFEELIPSQLKWVVTNDKATADVLLAYDMERGPSSTIIMPGGGVGTVISKRVKTVLLLTNTQNPDVIWRFEHRGRAKIAGDVVKRLQKDLAKLAGSK